MNDSIPICRSIFKHWIYADSEYLKVWLTMLGRARYLQEPKTFEYEKVLCTINYGEFIFGYKAWSIKTGISYQRLRGLVSKMVSDNMIKVKKQTSRYTVYEIINYAKFNSQTSQEIQGKMASDNSHVTVSQQSGNSHVTTNKEGIKKEKKDKKDIYIDYVAGYTDNQELVNSIQDFIAMRISIKKPMTKRALELMLDKLSKLATNDSDKIGILNQSIMNCYQGIFELKRVSSFNGYPSAAESAINSFYGGTNGTTENNKRPAGRSTKESEDFTTIDVCFSKCQD